MFILFLPENPMSWVLIVGVIFLLFGGAKLPQLAKALGQSKRAFKEGLEESEDKGPDHQKRPKDSVNQLLSVAEVNSNNGRLCFGNVTSSVSPAK